MLTGFPGQAITLCVKALTYDQFVNDIADYLIRHDVDFKCVIGHKSTVELVRKMLEWERPIAPREELDKCERRGIHIKAGDIVYAVLLGFRPEEGKVYTYSELEELLRQAKMTFWAIHYGPC